jgi:hypothetical protein
MFDEINNGSPQTGRLIHYQRSPPKDSAQDEPTAATIA